VSVTVSRSTLLPYWPVATALTSALELALELATGVTFGGRGVRLER
jgi:hypothetical protein